MADPDRGEGDPLERLLFDEPYRFDFFQAVRLLERLGGSPGTIGHDSAGRESVRFTVHQSLGFPASSIHDLRREPAPHDAGESSASRASDLAPEMTVAFFGLTGPSGILPPFYTTFLRRCLREGDRSTPAFFDLFNHRLISLFFRAGIKYRVAEDAGLEPERTAFGRALLALIGLAGESLRGRHELEDRRLLARAGLFARQVPTAEGLTSLIAETLGLEVEVEQCVTRWVEIGVDLQSRLGRSGTSNELGVTLMIGRRFRDAQGKFRLRIGPLDFDAFRELLPGTPAWRRLSELTRLYVGPQFVFDVELILRADQVPKTRLSAGSPSSLLGRYSWIRAGAASDDVSAIFAEVDRPG